jgi:hypothetical protein
MEQRLARDENFVAQIFNLPYRRVELGRASGSSNRFHIPTAPQIANLRYSRMQFCATFAAFLDFHFYFPDKLFASRIIVSSCFGRASAP